MNAYRSSNGAPGPEYWQNEADYELHATLDTEHKQLRATEMITYTNNSPDVLPSVWVQLDQNIYRRIRGRTYLRRLAASATAESVRRSGYECRATEDYDRWDSSSTRSRSSRASRRRRRSI